MYRCIFKRVGAKSFQQRVDQRISHALDDWVADKGYLEPLDDMDKVADKIGVSKEQLQYHFRACIGVPFRKWCLQKRIGEAKKLLLQHPDLSASLIGQMVGIPDKSNFRKLFRKEVGCTPTEWRSGR